MSIQSEIDRIKGSVAEAYAAVYDKGGIVPEAAVSGNLESAIRSIPSGEAPAGSNIPSGGIIIWSGSSDVIPDGWHICDGTEGTPDLRGRFVIGTTDVGQVSLNGPSTFVSNNAGDSNSEAAIILRAKKDISGIDLHYSVRSEEDYDIFRVRVHTPVITDPDDPNYDDDTTVKSTLIGPVSGEADGTVSVEMTERSMLYCSYSKDSGVDSYSDCAKFWFVDSGGRQLTKAEIEELFDFEYELDGDTFRDCTFVDESMIGASEEQYHTGDTGGAAEVTLSTGNIPMHSHTEMIATSAYPDQYPLVAMDGRGSPSGGLLLKGEAREITDDDLGSGEYDPVAVRTAPVGENEPFSVMPPYYVLCYIMKL